MIRVHKSRRRKKQSSPLIFDLENLNANETSISKNRVRYVTRQRKGKLESIFLCYDFERGVVVDRKRLSSRRSGGEKPNGEESEVRLDRSL